MSAPGLKIVRELQQNRALLRGLGGQLNEAFDPAVIDRGESAVLVLDLERVTHVTSFGVREWIRALKSQRETVEGLFFVRASPRMTDQFNMVVGFDAGGALLSFRTFYVCEHCGESSECSFDAQLDREHFEALAAPARQCQSCGRDAVLDDDAAVLFEYMRSSRPPPPPPEVMALFRHGDSWIHEVPGVRLSTRPAPAPEGTVFRFGGIVDRALSSRRIVESAFGVTELELHAVTHFDLSASDKWRGLLGELSEKGKVRLVNCPPTFLRRAADDPHWLAGAEVKSAALPMRCEGCHATSWKQMPATADAWSAVKGTCRHCQRPLKTSVPLIDLSDFQAASLARPTPASPLIRTEPAAQRPGKAQPEPPKAAAFDQKYEVLCKIGQGGMADVFLVRQLGAMGFKRLVVIKKVRNDFLTDDRLLRLFLDEARLAARIQHPNVIRIHDLGRADETYYMVMDFVHGRSVLEVLRELRANDERVPTAIAASIAADLCAGLAAAHMPDSTGTVLVHRDVTPNNVLVGFDGGVKLVDFGLAGYHHFAKDELRARHILGNVPFIAPEVYLGQKAGPQADLWGVGLTLYTMLTGQNPFQRDSVEKSAVAIVHEKVSRPWLRIPRKLFAVIDRALQKAPEKRYSMAAEMERDLRAIIPKLGAPSEVGPWIRQLFAAQIKMENEYVRRQKAGTLADALLAAPPQEVARFYRVLRAKTTGAVNAAGPSSESSTRKFALGGGGRR